MILLSRSLLILILLFIPFKLSHAGDNQWYLGATGGSSLLEPITGSSGFELDQDMDAAFKVFAGYDFTDQWSVEGFYSYLGEATFVPVNFLEYEAYGLAGQFSWPDNQDGFSVFLKGGVNAINNFSSLPTERVDDLQFYGGAGLEYHLNHFISIRAEADYYEEDALYAGIGLRFRFGGTRREKITEVDDGFGPEIEAAETVHTPAAVDPIPVPVPQPQPIPQPVESVQEYIPDTAATIVPGISRVLEGVSFEFASPRLTAESKSILNAVVRDLQAQPELRVKIDGHTDSVGNENYNRRLSLLRARSVAMYLVEQGVARNRVKYLGFGGDRPRADNSTEQGRQLNRRVEILAY